MNGFVEISIIVFLATFISVVMRLFKQPLVVSYILTGIIVGPYCLNVMHGTDSIELLSKIGIATLLFILGINLNPTVIKDVGKSALFIGIGQVAFSVLLGFSAVFIFGFDVVQALYISIALAFSSTIIIIKILTDKGELGKLYGKLTVGVLLVQDIIATVVLLVMSSSHLTAGVELTSVLLALVLRGFVVAILLYLVSKYILPHTSKFFASSQELLFLFSIAWGLGLASIFYWLGFSVEIGALIAGITLSVSPFAYEMASRIKPLRDFFIILFFILLGSQMVWENVRGLLLPVVVLSLFVLIVKPLIVFFIMSAMGYRRRTSFFTGITIAQISEFSLILMSLGLSEGYLSRENVSLVTLVGMITIALSTYLTLYADELYERLEGFLKFISLRDDSHHERHMHSHISDVIIFGYDRVGEDFVHSAEKLGKKYLVVDYNPNSIQRLQSREIPFRYGDADDVEFLHELNLGKTELIVSTVPDFKTNMLLVSTYHHINPKGIIMVISHDVEHAKKLYLAGASYVIMPHYLGAHYAAKMIVNYGFDIEEYEKERTIHLMSLQKREG